MKRNSGGVAMRKPETNRNLTQEDSRKIDFILKQGEAADRNYLKTAIEITYRHVQAAKRN